LAKNIKPDYKQNNWATRLEGRY